MADGRFYLSKIREVFVNDTTLNHIMGNKNVRIAHFAVVNNTYPQICIWLDEGQSEMVFPAGHYVLDITVWVDKNTKEPYKLLRQAITRINELVNRKASSLSEIDLTENTGLRVVKNLKSGGEIEFSKDSGKYYALVRYEVVISEGEDFSDDAAGDKEWV